MVTGKAAHIMMVIAAWSQMDDPNKSAVVDKVEFAPPPHAPGLPTAPGLGHWLGGVSRNVPDGRKRATVEFLRWFQTKDAQLANVKAGGIPVNAAVYRDPIAQEHRYRWMKPHGGGLAARRQHLPVPAGQRGYRHSRPRLEPRGRRRDHRRSMR